MRNLYLLYSTPDLDVNDCVFVNGPYDDFGYIISSEEKIKDGFQLYSIRGTGRIPTNWPVHDSVTFSIPTRGGACVRVTDSLPVKGNPDVEETRQRYPPGY